MYININIRVANRNIHTLNDINGENTLISMPGHRDSLKIKADAYVYKQ